MNKDFRTFSHQFVAATQPINVLAFVFDGVNYGASDFAYSAYSMVYFASQFSLLVCQSLVWLIRKHQEKKSK